MRTAFSSAQLADPALADAEKSLRACVHCGICTATCPTYVLLGDERDGPRGRIVMMQGMLEADAAPSAETVEHLDRCLSCLGCRTACPSGVDYARLIDTARAHVEARHRRPLGDRMMRWTVARLLTRPGLARVGIAFAKIFAPVARHLPGRPGAMARMALKAEAPAPSIAFAGPGAPVALLEGCVQPSLAPSIDAALVRVLARRGLAVESLTGCCGALAHHMGRRDEARALARRVIETFEAGGSKTLTISATGCSAHLLDYPHLFAGDPAWEPRAKAFAARVKDVSALVEPRAGDAKGARVAWQAPCSLQHGLRNAGAGKALLEAAGYEVSEIPEGHLCCGSAGSYSLLQPRIAGELRARKLEAARGTGVDMIATANIGCLMHLSGADAPVVVHLAELIDWAEGGPRPAGLAGRD